VKRKVNVKLEMDMGFEREEDSVVIRIIMLKLIQTWNVV